MTLKCRPEMTAGHLRFSNVSISFEFWWTSLRRWVESRESRLFMSQVKAFDLKQNHCLLPNFDVYPAGHRSHSHLSPAQCWCGGHLAGAGVVVGMYHGRQIQKISSNSYLKPFLCSQTHLLFTFDDPTGHWLLSTLTHSDVFGLNTKPFPQWQFGKVPSRSVSNG